ncbi:MAG: hypothetical protein Q8L64_04965 [bacterium]|nr:hypothetical protein [bacterium]
MSNLIIGVIKNYAFRDVKPFVSTLKNVGYKGDTVFFCNNVSAGAKRELQKNGVTCIDFTEDYPYVEDRLKKEMGIVPREFVRKLHLFSMRYILYYLYLLNCGKTYENIMVADIRDVVFQKDPFDFPIDGKLCCSIESEEWPISRSDFNGREIEVAFGKEAYEKIKDKLISNCGVTIGPSHLIKAYIEKMIELILAGDGSILMDQGTHNYIVWNDLVPNIRMYKNNEGPVLTLGYEKTVRRNKDKKIIDSNGTIINIVHQYDRHFGVAKDYYDWRLKVKYGWVLFRNRYIKGLNDHLSAKVKKSSPGLHAFAKKLKTFIR